MLRLRIKSRKIERKTRRRRIYGIWLRPDEVYLLRHSTELSKAIGLQLISATRKRKLRLVAIRLGEKYTQVIISRVELKLLFAHYVQQIICGDMELTDRLRYFKRYLGSQESKKIEQQVAGYERLKAIHEDEDMEEVWELTEEDFDMWRGR